MDTLAANSGVTVSLVAGYILTAKDGYGTMQIAPPLPNGQTPSVIQVTPSGASLGPFPQTVNVNINASPGRSLTYSTDDDGDPTNVKVITDPATGGITESAGGVVTKGALQSGAWANPPSIFRLLLNGTGTVTLDAKDAAGNITPNVYSVTLVNAVNQIDYPFAGDSAISIRATFTGTATAKVI